MVKFSEIGKWPRGEKTANLVPKGMEDQVFSVPRKDGVADRDFRMKVNCRHERPFGLRGEVTLCGDSELCNHRKTDRCSHNHPHKIRECGEFLRVRGGGQ